jgi:predicted dehydrogenase
MADLTRRSFLGSAGALGIAAGQATAANDRINVGMIAVGSRSQELLEAIKKVPGTEVVGISDAYRGRLERAQERTGGRAKIYLNHEEMLADPNIDAVTVGSPDHWHKDHVIAALEAGKDVYCEKPLTRTIDEGAAIAAAVKKSGKLLQVGSQGISSSVQARAREWVKAGKLGRVTMIRASYNRNTASGAWVYPIPPDASPRTVDWRMFLGSAPEHPFDLERFFRWRCYQEYSGGIATDLFVHLTTTIHYVMNAAMPSHVVGRGSLYRWKESRDVPDTLNAILEYPEGFTVNLSSTFNNQYDPAGSFEFLGTEGTLLLGWSKLTFIPERNFEANGWITQAWPTELEQAYNESPEVKRESEARGKVRGTERKVEEYKEVGASPTVKHMAKFFESVRSRKPTVEGVEAAHRAAACAHMVNESARSDKLLKWDFKNDRQKV